MTSPLHFIASLRQPSLAPPAWKPRSPLIPTRLAARRSTALRTLRGSPCLRRLFPADPALSTAAELSIVSGVMLRACGVVRPERGPALPPHYVHRQNLMHREAEPNAPAEAPQAPPKPRQDPVHREPAPHQTAAPEREQGLHAAPAAEIANARQDSMHRKPASHPAAATRREQGLHAPPAGEIPNARQEPKHREKAANAPHPATPEPAIPRQHAKQPPASNARGTNHAAPAPAENPAAPRTQRYGSADLPPSPRTGPLRNGNPRGNPNAAPRCGASTRSGCPCRAPALRGKLRCRMHGGASTGPRTAEGLERLRAARTIHGRYAGAARTRSRFLLTFIRRSQVHVNAMCQEARLPPSARARLHAMPQELAMPPRPPSGQPPPSRTADRAFCEAEAKALAPWKSAIALARAARHTPPEPEAVQALDAIFRALPPVRPPTPPDPAELAAFLRGIA